MKVTAYIVQCCGKLKHDNEVYGVIYKPDMYDTYNSLLTVDAEKSQIHYCVDCYHSRVIDYVPTVVRRKNNEDKYQEKLKEMAYVFKKSLFNINELTIL
jgi:hypothetical protein